MDVGVRMVKQSWDRGLLAGMQAAEVVPPEVERWEILFEMEDLSDISRPHVFKYGFIFGFHQLYDEFESMPEYWLAKTMADASGRLI